MIRVRLSNGTTLDYNAGSVKQYEGLTWLMRNGITYVAAVPKDAVIEFEAPVCIRYRRCLSIKDV
jgi:hypothetical protein